MKKAIIPKSLAMQEKKTKTDRISFPRTGKKFPFIIATDWRYPSVIDMMDQQAEMIKMKVSSLTIKLSRKPTVLVLLNLRAVMIRSSKACEKCSKVFSFILNSAKSVIQELYFSEIYKTQTVGIR